jgi:uncharacterized protein with PQ loop repeat
MLGLRHLYQRKKRLSGEEQTVKTVVQMSGLDLLIYFAAIAGPLALLPQVFKLYTSHDAAGLALPTWLMFGALNSLWIFYGYKHKEKPIVITNSMLLVLNFTIVFGILLFA